MKFTAVRPAIKPHRLVILAILLVAFGLRCRGLDWQELRGDEAFGYFFSLLPFGEIVEQTVALREPHPVASYWMQHIWLGLAGHSEVALRFSGVWWSVLAVALMLPLATHLALSVWSAVGAAMLMALSPYVIWHAQDARMYSMSLALTMLSTYMAVRWWRDKPGRGKLWRALGYLLVTWLALHTHYFSLYIIAAQHFAMIGWAVADRAWRQLGMWWGMGVLLLLMWLPWLLTAWSILTGYGGNGDSPGLLDAFVRAQSAYGVGESVPDEMRLGWALLTLAAMGFGALALWRLPKGSGRTSLWFLVAYWLIPLLMTWLSAQNRPIFNERYLVAAVPPVYLLMAAVLGHNQAVRSWRWAIWMGWGLLFGVIGGMVLGGVRQTNDPQFSKSRGWRELAAVLEPLTASESPNQVRVIQNYPDPTLWYYFRSEVAHLVLPHAPNDEVLSRVEVARMVDADVGRVLLIEQPSESWDADGIARRLLGEEFVLAATTSARHWPISIWLRAPEELEPLQVEYVNGLTLTGALFTPKQLAPGGVLAVHLRWQGDAAYVSGQVAVSVQLLNDAGQLVAQSDRPLDRATVRKLGAADGAAQTPIASYAILLPNALMSGEYQLAIVVYDPSQAGTPRWMTLQGEDSHPLGKVIVETP